MEEEEEMLPPVIILDNGSGYLKAGYSNQKYPEICIPSLVGRQVLRYGQKVDINLIKQAKTKKEQKTLIKELIKERHMKEIMIGDEVIPFKNMLELCYPLSEGIIKNDEDLYKLWDYVITQKLGIEDPSEKKVIVTEAPLNPITNKVKMCEILFEKIGVGAINIEPQAKCTLFSEGLTNGIVLDSGDGVTHCIPVSEGYILKHSIERMDIAGRAITHYLIRLLQKKGYAFNSSADFEFIRELKEKLCFVSADIDADRQLERTTTFYNTYYRLPDGSRILISDEKFEAPEVLFDPSLIGVEQPSVSEMVFNSINNCPIDCRAKLYDNVILSGANTLFPGFASRLEREIRQLYKIKNLKSLDAFIKIPITVRDNPNRKYSVFLGASIIGNHYNTEDNEYWITRDEWLDCEDTGDYTKNNLIKAKCQSYFNDPEDEKK